MDNMNTIIRKFLLTCLATSILGACAVKEHTPDAYKNYTAKQIYRSGEKAMSKHDYRDAVKYFEAIDALYPFDPEAEQGQLKVIDAYYKADDHASALAAANRYIHMYPEGVHTAYVFYMKGIINYNKEQSILHRIYPRDPEKLDISSLNEAYADFEELLRRFPQSAYAKDAEKHMLEIRHLLVQHDLHITKFYFERKAYIAAINRANEIIKYFGNTPQVKEALKIAIKAYRILGLEKQANDALQVLNRNFPKERV